jgi:hypothetical protein
MFHEVWVIVAAKSSRSGSLRSIGGKSLISKAEEMLEQYMDVEREGELIKEGKFDFWDPDRITVDRVSSLRLHKVVPSALITPAGEWCAPEEGLRVLRWGDQVRGLTNQHKDKFAVRVWCHV